MNKQEVMAKVALTEKDTGSPEVLLGQSDFGHNFLLVHSTVPLY